MSDSQSSCLLCKVQLNKRTKFSIPNSLQPIFQLFQQQPLQPLTKLYVTYATITNQIAVSRF